MISLCVIDYVADGLMDSRRITFHGSNKAAIKDYTGHRLLDECSHNLHGGLLVIEMGM
jgi:hypothetical protein